MDPEYHSADLRFNFGFTDRLGLKGATGPSGYDLVINDPQSNIFNNETYAPIPCPKEIGKRRQNELHELEKKRYDAEDLNDELRTKVKKLEESLREARDEQKKAEAPEKKAYDAMDAAERALKDAP